MCGACPEGRSQSPHLAVCHGWLSRPRAGCHGYGGGGFCCDAGVCPPRLWKGQVKDSDVCVRVCVCACACTCVVLKIIISLELASLSGKRNDRLLPSEGHHLSKVIIYQRSSSIRGCIHPQPFHPCSGQHYSSDFVSMATTKAFVLLLPKAQDPPSAISNTLFDTFTPRDNR